MRRANLLVLKSPKRTLSTLEARLPNLREPRTFENVSGQYVDRIVEVRRVSDDLKLRSKFEYFEVQSVPLSETEVTYFATSKRVDLSVADPPKSNIWYLHGSRTDALVAARFLGLGIYGQAEALLAVKFPPALLSTLEGSEALDIKAVGFKNVDAEVKDASLRGSLKTSPHFKDLRKHGVYSLIGYKSRATGKRIRVAAIGRVSMTGRGVTLDDLESYIENYILPHLKV